MSIWHSLQSVATVLAAVLMWSSVGLAQNNLIPKGDFGFGSDGGDDGAKVVFTGKYQYDKEAKKARLSITAETEPDWHVYSLTQKKLPDGGGGPGATKILVQSDALADPKLLADGKLTDQYFTADRDPKKHIDTESWPGLELEEHEGAVTWLALLDLAEGTDPEQAAFKVTVRGQVCKTNGSCIPVKEALDLKFDGYYEPPKKDGRFQGQHLLIEGYAEREAGQVKLTFTATPDSGWHVYARENTDPIRKDGSGKPTLIAPTKVGELTFAGITASAEPKTKLGDGIVGTQRYHEQPVTWTLTLNVPRSEIDKPQTVAGYIGWQVCQDEQCLFPEAAKFELTFDNVSGKQPLAFVEAKYDDAAKAAASPPYFVPEEITLAKLLIILGFGVIGGVILNLMPCVLPVIGLKILSFAEQGGQSRGQVFALNVSYSAGLIAVFLALATIAVFLNLSWGQQFTYTWFKVAMVGLVFAMAISFLGVWEIPIPGFASTNKTDELQQKEGLGGAFFKGIFTTLLATPCSGPFLGTVFGFTLGQAWWVTYLIFFSVGFGMALPYLLIGLQPSLVRWLPRPGEWMDTFKQFMGFVLLGTVVYLFSIIHKDYYLPTLTMIVGIWFGCWCIGRVPAWAELGQKVRGWATGLGAAAVITAAAFFVLAPWPKLYQWTPYTNEALVKAQAEGKTVMVDFTADWCQTCQWNFFWAINSLAVKDVVERNNVQPLLADWTEPSDEIQEKLGDLRSRSIPLLAIYPANRPGEVIVLKDLITRQQLLDALEEAGPSKPATTAMREQPPDPAEVSSN
jgi:suppressor for copper-sensitivity B